MYPVFITDSSDDAYEPIPSLPSQARHGVKHLISHLKSLVNGVDCLPLKGKVMLIFKPYILGILINLDSFSFNVLSCDYIVLCCIF